MAKVKDTIGLVDGIVRLRRAERVPEVAEDVAPVRRALEQQVGPTLSRSRTARILGASQTALDRWVDNGQVPVVVTPSGRREVPRQVVIELRETIDRLREKGIARHPLAAALAERRQASKTSSAPPAAASRGHETAERRGLAYHRAVAERLDGRLVADARDRVARLEVDGHLDSRHAAAWSEVLGRSLADIARAITDDSQEGSDLRQNSPFAGVLNEHERREIIATVG
jgi:DNA-binding transcriptional MerR regulator